MKLATLVAILVSFFLVFCSGCGKDVDTQAGQGEEGELSVNHRENRSGEGTGERIDLPSPGEVTAYEFCTQEDVEKTFPLERAEGETLLALLSKATWAPDVGRRGEYLPGYRYHVYLRLQNGKSIRISICDHIRLLQRGHYYQVNSAVGEEIHAKLAGAAESYSQH